ncbi:MAG: ferredoxin family protein [Clostridiales bacterium]|nr:ferredoxin family protein [Clostridiales bacterium]
MIKAIEQEKCIGCGRCVNICPLDTLRMKDGKAVIAYPEDCHSCYLCEMACSVNAVYVHPFKEQFAPAFPKLISDEEQEEARR